MSDREFTGKIVVVTGAASGIGEAIAVRFASEGAIVALVDVSATGLERVAASIAASGGSSLSFEVDASDEDQVARMRSQLAERGDVYSLINQAGIIRRAVLAEQTLAEWELIQRNNVTSMFIMARAFLPAMVAAGGGTVVNCSSGAAFESGRELAAYSASKGAVVAFTRSLCADFGPSVRVNAVCPGLIETPGAYVGADAATTAARHAAAERTPLARMGTPEEVSDVVFFLASRQSSFCSGAAVMVDGGKLAAS